MDTVLQNPLLIRNILLNATYESIINWCRSHRAGESICYDKIFWQQKAQQDFGTLFQESNDTKLSPAQRYLQLFTDNGGVTFGSENYLSMNDFMERAIRSGRQDLVQYLINLGYDNWELMLEKYARKGDIVNVNLISTLVPYEDSLILVAVGALRGGNVTLFNLIKARDPSILDSPEQLISAAVKSGNLSLVIYILNITKINNWYGILLSALRSNQEAIFDYFYPRVSLIDDWNQLLSMAISSGNPDLFLKVYKMVPPATHISWQYLIGVINTVEMFRLIRSMIPPDISIDWNVLIQNSVAFDNMKLFKEMQKVFPPANYNWDWDELLQMAVASGNKFMFDTIYDLIPPDKSNNVHDIYALSELLDFTHDPIFNQHVLSKRPK